MDSDTSPQPVNLAAPAWLKWMRVLLVIALSAAGYLAWEAIHHGALAGCGAQSGCNAVLQSRWAYWMGVPVSVPAVLIYVVLLVLTVLLQKRPSPDDQRGTLAAMIILSVVVAGSAFWFVSLQVFVIQSFCKYCLTAHVCGFAAALICLTNIPYATDPDTPMWRTGSGKRGVPRQAVLSLIVIGLAGVATLAVGQLLVQKERNIVKVVKSNAPTPGTNLTSQAVILPAEIVPGSPGARLIAPRTLSLYSNEFLIKFDEVPLMGSPDAPHVIVCLVDYTCVHCRALHPILLQTSRQFSNQLAIVCLPVTLSPLCNPFISHTDPRADTNACEYARLGLAVWRAKPGVHGEYDDWFFASTTPPPLNVAREHAAQLVGKDRLDSALADPWVAQQIQTDCKLYRANWLAADNSALPQIVMGNAVSSGPINSMEHLQILLNQYMGLDLGSKGQ